MAAWKAQTALPCKVCLLATEAWNAKGDVTNASEALLLLNK